MEVHGMSAERILEIEAETIVSGGINTAGNLVLQKANGASVNAGKVVPDIPAPLPLITRKVEIFTTANALDGAMWIKPLNASRVRVILIGGGSGGGGPTSTYGGVGGSLIDITLPASMFNVSATVTVGAGGAGGTGSSPGVAGGDASINIKGQLLVARGGGMGTVLPGWATMGGRSLKGGGPFANGNGAAASTSSDPAFEEFFGTQGGGGFGQKDPLLGGGGEGYFGFTAGGIKGTSPGSKGQDGSILEGIPGGGGAIPTDSTPGHGGTPGGGGGRGNGSTIGGTGGAAQACIITYYNLDN